MPLKFITWSNIKDILSGRKDLLLNDQIKLAVIPPNFDKKIEKLEHEDNFQ